MVCTMTGRLFRPQRRTERSALVFTVCLCFATSTHAQATVSERSVSAETPPAYEVISVKPSKPSCDVMSFNSPPGRLTIRCYDLRRLLYIAYSINLDAKIPGMPRWGDSAHFDIDAKADEAMTDAMSRLNEREQTNQRQRMLQAILADRFKLTVRAETREGPVYNLIVAKDGFRLKSAPESERSDDYYSWGRGRIVVRKGPIASFVYCLSDGLAGRTVIDKTGLSGNYDIDLTWTPDDQPATADSGPSIFTALEEQLGLKLVPAKGPVDVFVIDHVERPSAN